MTPGRRQRVPVVICGAALLTVLASCGRPQADSVVLIVVDTLRADHLGFYGAERPTSPRLDQRVKEGAVFEYALSTSPWTLPAFGSIFTGQLPSRHRAGIFPRPDPRTEPRQKQFGKLDESVPTLAEVLREEGFATGAVVNNAFLGPSFGVDRGFDDYDLDPGSQQHVRRANVSVNRALRWLDEHGDGRFFLLLHLFDPHMTYDPPEPFLGRFSNSVPVSDKPRVTDLHEIRPLLRRGGVDMAYLEALYDEEILFVDSQLGRLFDELEERGLLERSLVILTSDHGEEFLEHGKFEHGHSVFDEVLRVPLVIWGPAVTPGRLATPVSLVDLFSTVLDAVGVEREGIPGRSLGPLLAAGGSDRGAPLVAEGTLYGPERRALVRWPYKLTYQVAGAKAALYDLEADPGEGSDLMGDRPEIARRLGAQLQAMVAAAEGQIGSAEAADLDPETLEALRSLGYIQ